MKSSNCVSADTCLLRSTGVQTQFLMESGDPVVRTYRGEDTWEGSRYEMWHCDLR